ncbi:MAG: glycosyltransferase [Anaerolineales bacterium]|nr:glycosyltransferase [Anaerolineales bacterium]
MAPVFIALAENNLFAIDVFCGPIPKDMGFVNLQPQDSTVIRFHQGLTNSLFGRIKSNLHFLSFLYQKKPDIVLAWVDTKKASFWFTLLLGKLLRIPVFSRGHGAFKRRKAKLLHQIAYQLILRLSHSYVCYTIGVKQSLMSWTHNPQKLLVDHNSMHNGYPILPAQKHGQEQGLLYLGRLRGNCGIEILIDAVKKYNSENAVQVDLHIIGGGPLSGYVKNQLKHVPQIHYYGELFDQEKISIISKACRWGVGPGFMGLNVVHMMSLSLPVLTHCQLDLHMGPEPEYLKHQRNGWLMPEQNSIDGLLSAVNSIWDLSPEETKKMQSNAFKTYQMLSAPPYYERLARILLEEADIDSLLDEGQWSF